MIKQLMKQGWLALLSAFVASVAMAQVQEIENDDALYAAPVSDKAAFVRLIYVGEETIAPTMGGVSLGRFVSPAIGKYVELDKGEHALKAGDVEVSFSLAEGSYYSLLVKGKEVTLHQDVQFDSPSKAIVRFYNMSESISTSLAAIEHGVDVFSGVQKMSGVAREMNAVSLTLAAKAGSSIAGMFNGVSLFRREGMSFVIYGDQGAYKVMKARDDVMR